MPMEDARSTRGSPSQSTPTMAKGSTASMKLFVDTSARRVAFAEAGKDMADFLFSLLALPLGRADRLLAPLGGAGGSIGNLYTSVERMDPAHVQPGAAAKKTLLHPTVLSLPARAEHSFHPRRELYTCPTGIISLECSRNVTDERGTRCPSCGGEMTSKARYVPPPPSMPSSTPGEGEAAVKGAPEGFVRGGAAMRYIVTDDLQVLPSSAGELVALVPALRVADVGALQECEVRFGLDEGKEILKAVMLQSKTVLTDVFFGR